MNRIVARLLAAEDGHLGDVRPVGDGVSERGPENGYGMEELMSEEYRRFDPADYVKSEEDVRGLLMAAAEEDTGDGAVIRATLKHVAQTHNMSALSRDTGLNRGNLYEALSDGGNPTLATLLKVTAALGLRLRLEPVGDGAQGAQPANIGISRQESTST